MTTNTIPPASSIQTFALDLGDGVRCTARVNIARIAALKQIEILPPDTASIKWEGAAKNIPAHFEAYRVWIADVWQFIADTANKSAALVLITPEGRALCIACEPKSRPDFVFLPL